MLDLIGKLLVRNIFEHPIIVVGASRSGTSILLQALGHHPLILAMRGEAPFLTTVGGSAHLFEYSENKDYYLDSIKTSKEYLYSQLKKIGFEIAAGPHYGLRQMAKGFLGHGGSPLGRRYWAAKTFPSEPVTHGLIKLYPGVRFIYIRRNGCDVIQSRTKFHGFNEKDFQSQCKAWADSVEKYDHLARLDQAIAVKQEDLLQNPRQFFDEVADFLGMARHSGPADYANSTLVHPLDQNTQQHQSVKDVISSRPPAHTGWTNEQKALFKDICGSAMHKAGYEVPF